MSVSAHHHRKHLFSFPSTNTFAIFTDLEKSAYSMLERIFSGGLSYISSSSICSRREKACLPLEVPWDVSQLYGGSGWHNFSVAEWYCQV